MTPTRAEYARKVLEGLKAGSGGRCETCGSPDNLEFHHQFPTGLKGEGRGLPNRAADIKRNPLCYLLLCRSCHKKEHPSIFPMSAYNQADDLEESFLREHPEIQVNGGMK